MIDTTHLKEKTQGLRMGMVGMNSKIIFGLFAVVSLIFVFSPAYAESLAYGLSYNQAGDAVSLYDYIKNPNDKLASASITFVFEDIDSGNHWDEKTHTGHISGNSQFSADQSYFIRNHGQFYIHTEYELNGQSIKESQTRKFVIFDQYSDAALNGCNVDHKLIVKPSYSKAVCVSEKSFEKLVQRGWIGETVKDVSVEPQEEKLGDMNILRLENHYKPNDQIKISGSVWMFGYDFPNDDTPVTIQIQNPENDLVEIAQVKLSDGVYSHVVNAAGPMWNQNGLYTVKASYGEDIHEQTSFAFSSDSDKFSPQNALHSESYAYEDLCGFAVTDDMHMQAIYDNSHRFTREGIPYFELNPATFSHVELAPYYASNNPHLNYWFDLDNKPKQVSFRIGACDVDGSNIQMGMRDK